MEQGNIAQGPKATNTSGIDTGSLLNHDAIKIIPADSKITYTFIVVDCRLQKLESNRVRSTVEWNLIEFPHKLITKAANLIITKVL